MLILSDKNKDFIGELSQAKKYQLKLERIVIAAIPNKNWARTRFLTFDEVIEVLWRLRVYPLIVNKKKLKFYFWYTSNKKEGVSLEELGDILMYISLQKEDCMEAIGKMINLVLKYKIDPASW